MPTERSARPKSQDAVTVAAIHPRPFASARSNDLLFFGEVRNL